MTLTSDLCFGHTRSLHGVYNILGTLRQLSRWLEEVFQPWAAEAFRQRLVRPSSPISHLKYRGWILID